MEERPEALQTESLPQPCEQPARPKPLEWQYFLPKPLKWHYFLTWVILWLYAAYLLGNGVTILTIDFAAEVDNGALIIRFMPAVQWLQMGLGVFLIVLAAAVIVVRFMLARRVRGARMALYVTSVIDMLWWPLMPLLIWLSMKPMTALSGSTPAYLYAQVYGVRLWIGPAIRAALLALHLVYYHKRGAMFGGGADEAAPLPSQPEASV